MEYHSLDEIKNEFNIEEIDDSIIRKRLKLLLHDVHPDKNGGDFASSEDKKKYLRLQDAIDYIDNGMNSMIPMKLSDITELVKTIQGTLVKTPEPEEKIKIAETRFEKAITTTIDYRVNRLKFPKIALSAFTGIVSFLWMFPQMISEHIILKQYIDISSNQFAMMWSVFLFYFCVFWVLCWLYEYREKEFKEKLGVEQYQNLLFEDFISSTMHHDMFCKTELIEYLMKKRERGSLYLMGRNFIDLPLAQNLANLILLRAEAKGVIEKIPEKSLDDIYRVTALTSFTP